MENNREVINDVLVNLFNEIWQTEGRAISTEEFSDITNNDFHIIEAVGPEGGNMSSIAAKLNITVGSLTTSMSSLVNKGYVKRERTEKDRRVVYIRLTEKGQKAYEHHKQYHEQLTDSVLRYVDERDATLLANMLKGLAEFFREYPTPA